MHRKLLSILIITLLLNIMGCSQYNTEKNIDEFNISYIEKIDSKYLVENNVTISVKVPNAKSVQLIMQDLDKDEVENIIEGKKSNGEWLFEYENNDLFTKEVWVLANFDKEKKESEKKVITNIDQSFESVFENIMQINPGKINLLKQNVNLDIIGWLDNSEILAKDSSSFFLYNIHKNEKDIIRKDVWNIFANYYKDKIIYEDRDGLHFLNILEDKQKKIFDIESGMTLKDLVWAGDSNSIIINIAEKDNEHYYHINLINDSIKQIELDKNYEFDNMFYFDNKYLFTFGKLKLSGDENKNYSEHLLGIDIINGNLKDYTPNIQIMDDLRVLSQINEGEFLIRISNATVSEDDISSLSTIYILDTQRRNLKKYNIVLDSPYVFNLFTDKSQHIYLANKENNNKSSLNEKIIILGENNKEEAILSTFQFYPTDFYWSKDGRKIVFYLENSKEIFLIEKK